MPESPETAAPAQPVPVSVPNPNPPRPPAPAPAPPPATQTVLQGEITEETMRLRQQNEELAAKLKAREMAYSELERTHQEYRQMIETAQPTRPKVKHRGPLGVTLEGE